MISIEEALQIVQAQEFEPAIIDKDLQSSLGHCLAEAITAPFDLPDFDNSAMDGYALCGNHQTYRIIGEVAAGDTSTHRLQDEEAIRIFTGGRIPENTTSVVMQEKTEVAGEQLTIDSTVSSGQNIRPKGGELRAGQKVFSPGHQITPASIGLIGSLGKPSVKVFKKPSIHLITTGNELITSGTERKIGQIYESNSLAIISALNQFGLECQGNQQIEDDFELIKTGISNYLNQTDVLLLSGGISVGDYDYVKAALEENGVQEIFYKVFQKPGKPLYFGRKDNTFVFALPGNPASSLTCFYIHVLPLLLKISGSQKPGLTKVLVPLAHDYELKGDRPAFLKAHIENHQVTILDGQSSSMIYSLAMGNALACISTPQKFKAGNMIECALIS
ncbi:MAG: molybdopterin molybdotransferase MoeA [Marinoscillum sp.]